MEAILKSKYTLWAFFVITAALGWLNTKIDKSYVTKLSPTALVVVDAIIGTIALGLVLLFNTGGSFGNITKEMRNLEIKDIVKLLVLALVGSALGIFGTTLLEHHDVTELGTIEFLSALLVTSFAVIVLAEQKMTKTRAIGFAILAVGGYLTA